MTISKNELQRRIKKTVEAYYSKPLSKVGDIMFKCNKTNQFIDTKATTWLMQNGYIRTHINTLMNNVYYTIELTPYGLTFIAEIDGYTDPLKKKKKRNIHE